MTEIEERVARIESTLDDLMTWRRQAEAAEARRQIHEGYLKDRLDKIELNMEAGFKKMGEQLVEKLQPFLWIYRIIVGSAAGGVALAVTQFVLNGGLKVI